MTGFPPLEAFGSRICICGPSNAGKSTLAHALAAQLGMPAIHLDLLRHLPHTNWEQRPDEEFVRLHEAAIQGDRWIIEGNYFSLIDSRLERATGLVLLGSEPWRGLVRYVRRTLFQKNRVGQLQGNQDSLKWAMIRWIILEQPKKHASYLERLEKSSLPLLVLYSLRELNALYAAWGLRHQASAEIPTNSGSMPDIAAAPTTVDNSD